MGGPVSRKPLIVANWKMNKLAEEAAAFARQLKEYLGTHQTAAEVGLAPTNLHLSSVARELGSGPALVAGQNCHEQQDGAFTGEVSAPMLRDAGAHAVILGHSERRHVFGEPDHRIRLKLAAAAKAGLTPILCVGETSEERDANVTLAVVDNQLGRALADLASLPLEPGTLVVAYEPVWAIGTGRAATPADAQDVTASLRRRLETAYSPEWAAATRVLYGGSSSPKNAQQYLSQPDVDGLLVGGASLEIGSFTSIIEAAGQP